MLAAHMKSQFLIQSGVGALTGASVWRMSRLVWPAKPSPVKQMRTALTKVFSSAENPGLCPVCLCKVLVILPKFCCPFYMAICCERRDRLMDENGKQTGAKGIIWPEIITQSTPKSWWNTNMKACIFGSFNSTQRRLITVMALSCDAAWKYLILVQAVCHYCWALKCTQAQSCAHSGAMSTDGYYVFSGLFHLSLSFFITIFIIIMWRPQGAARRG